MSPLGLRTTEPWLQPIAKGFPGRVVRDGERELGIGPGVHDRTPLECAVPSGAGDLCAATEPRSHHAQPALPARDAEVCRVPCREDLLEAGRSRGHGAGGRAAGAAGSLRGLVRPTGDVARSHFYGSEFHLTIQVSLSTEMTCSHRLTSASSASGVRSPDSPQSDRRRSSSSAVRRNSSSWYSYLAAVE